MVCPFELKPRGELDLIKKNWEEGPSPSKNEIQYVMDLRATNRLGSCHMRICSRLRNVNSISTIEG